MQPRFSRDFSKIAYVARDTKFLSHSANYQLKQLSWPLDEASEPVAETLIDRVAACPNDDQEFAGLYGYNDTFSPARFIADSAKFFLFTSELKGQHRIFVLDTTTKEVKMLRIPNVTDAENLRSGEYSLMRIFEDTLIVNYS